MPKLWTLLQDVDCVYHLAARVSVPESILYPREYNAVNVGGTVAVMEAIRDAGVKRVVFASSGAVYGTQPQQPVHEDLPPNPDSPYAVSKLAAEHYVRTIGALWNIETVCLRIFNAYGPGQALPPSHAPVIPQFIKQALSSGSIVMFGEGGQTPRLRLHRRCDRRAGSGRDGAPDRSGSDQHRQRRRNHDRGPDRSDRAASPTTRSFLCATPAAAASSACGPTSAKRTPCSVMRPKSAWKKDCA